MKKVLLTGACGNLGREVCRHLLEQGHDVRATDRAKSPKIPIPVMVANLLNREACYGLVEDVEAVVHLANHPNHHGTDAQTVLVENTAMNMNLFQAAAESGVKKIIYASSVQAMASTYDHEEPKPDDSTLEYLPSDGDSPPKPGNPYGLSKQLGETMLSYFARVHGMSTIACRLPFIVSSHWIRHFWRYFNSKRRSGARRDFSRATADEGFAYISAADAARLFDAILRTELPGYRCYFPAAPWLYREEPIPQLLEELYQGVPLRKPVDEMTGFVDISRVTRETGWVPLDDVRNYKDAETQTETTQTQA
jgi:nucleoside-diphosphate-sugar epimerase